MIRRCVAVAAIAFATVVPLHVANAADNGAFSVQPSPKHGQDRAYVDLDLPANATARDSFTIINKTRLAITFDLYGADASDSEQGAFVLAEPKQPRREVGAWVQLPAAKVRVPGSATYLIPFTVHVPANATPGDYAGGIVALARAGSIRSAAGQSSVEIRRGAGIRIYVRVRGVLSPRIAIGGLHYDVDRSLASLLGGRHDAIVLFTVLNTGNVRLTPSTTVTVTGFHSARRVSVPVPELLPGGSAALEAHINGVRGLGQESATVVASAAGAGTVVATTTILVVPWLLAALVVVMLAAVLGLGWQWRRRRRGRKASAPPPNDGESVARALEDAVTARQRDAT